MGRGFFWGIALFVIAVICFFAGTGMGNENYSQQGAYCIAGVFFIASLPFLITAFAKYAGQRKDATVDIQAPKQYQDATLSQQQAQQPSPPQGSTRRQLFVPQSLPKEQDKPSPKQPGR